LYPQIMRSIFYMLQCAKSMHKIGQSQQDSGNVGSIRGGGHEPAKYSKIHQQA
jgi:hypothetical protein